MSALSILCLNSHWIWIVQKQGTIAKTSTHERTHKLCWNTLVQALLSFYSIFDFYLVFCLAKTACPSLIHFFLDVFQQPECYLAANKSEMIFSERVEPPLSVGVGKTGRKNFRLRASKNSSLYQNVPVPGKLQTEI